ncbi:OmpA family protein [Grimontia hollisae]|uniref:Outer membrane protein n=2 Tax=Grimontia hollisae TaxID=673 RepID=D0I8W9_GRIHO|nr:OmpA family protein [Grimontia hollisae]AMG28907.1 OmpA family protein [Grimontia hollisae]EEY71884.1 outer membrane protein [Grimontia hollisae CIP 101886]STO77290.1 Outer membrane porin F precursor [Grimontia hollisae]STO98392.1 Outer membrane porin F precursor [Grimontia hollisae]STQ75782.1 Outer membrane porin F precursor [Grimontia hollisae]
MKHVLLISSILIVLGGCSLSADEPPLAEQRSDLFDADSDGVINARDLCDNTPQEAVIDNDGCPTYLLLESNNSLRIQFANDSAIVEPAYREALDKMAGFLKLYPETFLELQGHTSSPGSDDYNQNLSIQRAKAVQAHLIEKGVPIDRLTLIGLGEGDLMLADNTETTQFVNRRVVGRVKGFKGDIKEAWTIFTQREQ